MADVEVGARGKAGMGAACVVCCAVPMLVLTGAVSAAAALTGGVAVGAVVLVVATAYLAATDRLGPLPDRTRWAVAAVGAVLAAVGLWALDGGTAMQRSVLAGAVGLLATAALLALSATRGSRPAGA